jgi:Lon protease-like protein
MGDVSERFPLFPLGLVLLPTEIVPLHIFEERYKVMIGGCVEEGSEFGIVWLSDDELKEVGCTARVAQVLERTDDGRMNILAQGGRPFRMLRKIDDMPYPAGDVEMLDDDDEGDEELAASAREAYADLVERVTDNRPGDDELEGLDAYGMAATIELAAAPKQALLEERSEDRRLKVVGDLFSTALTRIDSAEEAQERAQSNGKVKF